MVILFPSASNARTKYEHKNFQLETKCGRGLKTIKIPILGIQVLYSKVVL